MPVVILERFNARDEDIDMYRMRMLHHIDHSCPKKNNIPVVGPHRGLGEWNWELLLLELDGATITLAICIDTIYLYGWKVGDFNSQEPWIFISGATPIGLEGEFTNLPFDGSYITLGQPHTISISRATLISSIQTLHACNPSQPSPQVKPALLTMILTFCVTIRIKPVYEEIRRALTVQGGRFLLSINTDREVNWRRASKCYLTDDQIIVDGYGVINHENVNRCLSVLLWHSKDTYKFPPYRGWQSLELPERKDEGTGSIEETRESKKQYKMKNRHLSRRRAGRKGEYGVKTSHLTAIAFG
jgi:Ribosome inactivating protein